MIHLESAQAQELRARICVIGVGGGGGNAVASMIRSGVQGVDFIVANTDAQALRDSPAEYLIQLGRSSTRGLGAGASAEIGRAAAEESTAEIEAALEGAHMCFVAAGMGGGTGTGAAPIIARIAKAKGILTVGVVTKPFAFEGRRRAQAADEGVRALAAEVDTLIVIPNQNLFRVACPETTFKQAFALADKVLDNGVRSITDLMVMPGIINLDFADVRSIMGWMGKAMLGCGEAAGRDRAIAAAELALSNPLLDGAIHGAKGLIISVAGGEDLKLMEIDEAANHIKALVDPEAEIVWGSTHHPAMNGRIRVSIVATGIEAPAAAAPCMEQLAQKAEPAPVVARAAAKVAKPVVPARPKPAAPAILLQAPTERKPLPTSCARTEAVEQLVNLEPPVLTDAAQEPAPQKIVIKVQRPEPLPFEQPQRGPSLFQRLVAMGRNGARAPAASPAHTVPSAPEDPQVYRRRAPLTAHAL